MREYARRRYLELREKGVCVSCEGHPRITGKTLCPKCLEKSRIAQNTFYHAHKERILKASSRRSKVRRFEVLKKIAEFHKKPIQCFSCLCTDISELEIEHSNNDGWDEKKKGWNVFITSILNGSRKLDDLLILCHVCNVCSYENFTAKSGRWEVIFYPNSRKAC